MGALDVVLSWVEWLLFARKLGAHREMVDKEPFVMIAGDFRCRTTLMLQIIAHHPDTYYFTLRDWSWPSAPIINRLFHKAFLSQEKMLLPHLRQGKEYMRDYATPAEAERIMRGYAYSYFVDEVETVCPTGDVMTADSPPDPMFVRWLKNIIAFRRNMHLRDRKAPVSRPCAFVWKNPLNSLRLSYFRSAITSRMKVIRMLRGEEACLQSQLKLQELMSHLGSRKVCRGAYFQHQFSNAFGHDARILPRASFCPQYRADLERIAPEHNHKQPVACAVVGCDRCLGQARAAHRLVEREIDRAIADMDERDFCVVDSDKFLADWKYRFEMVRQIFDMIGIRSDDAIIEKCLRAANLHEDVILT
jgi:hypothetical protein